MAKRNGQYISDESSLSPPADACTTSVLLGGFSLHLEKEMPPQPSPNIRASQPSRFAKPSPPPPPTSHLQRQEPARPSNAGDDPEGRNGSTGFFAGLQNMSRWSGSSGGGRGSGSWNRVWGGGGGGGGGIRNAQPWQQHPRAIIRGFRHSGASLSSLLGFSGSVSDLSDNGGGDADSGSSFSRRNSCSPAAAEGLSDTAETLTSKNLAVVGDGEGAPRRRDGGGGGGRRKINGKRKSETNCPRDFVEGGGGVMAEAAAASSLAVLTLGEITFEVNHTHLLRIEHCFSQKIVTHPFSKQVA